MRLAISPLLLAAALASAAIADGPGTVSIELRAAPGTRQVFPGTATSVWSFTGTLLEGRPDSLTAIPGSYLGPIIRVRRGDLLRVRFINDLPEPSIVHWHGLDVPAAMDGNPMHAVDPGESYLYEFPILNRAGTYWYHPHPHMRTGFQVNAGLAGMLIVEDGEEAALGLPSGEQEVPLVVQDRRIDAANQFTYAMPMTGFVGDRILVNGVPQFTLSAGTRAYRLRLLNGSNARLYKLAWGDGTPMTIIATDGGLLDAPIEKPYAMLAPGQRLEVWLDLTGRAVGSELALRSLAFSPGANGGFPALPNGSPFEIMRVAVDRLEKGGAKLPEILAPTLRPSPSEAANFGAPRTFPLAAIAGEWTINGAAWEEKIVAPNEIANTSTLELWRFVNTSPMMLMAHPMHIHGSQFRVAERTVQPGQLGPYGTVSAGLVDEGWLDTVLVMPGETVTILKRTSRYPGWFLYHCHILEHEDMGMMRNFLLVKPCPADVNDDGVVNGADLAAVLGAWGPRPGSLEDINGDGVVNGADLAAVLGSWGACGGK